MAAQTNTQEIRLSDHTTLVRDSGGNGIPVMLLHPMAMDNNFWNHGVFQKIAASHDRQGNPRRVIAYDMRGHGRAADAPITISCEQLANDLRQLCSLLHLNKIDIAGLSYGGAIAQQFVLDYPSLVRSAIFLGTITKGAPIFAERASIAEDKGISSLIQPTLERWFLPRHLKSNIAGVQYARKQLEITRVENWAAGWRALSKVDFESRYQEIEIPVLCLASEEDTSTPPALMKKIAESCKGGRYVELRGGMHLFPVEIPDDTAGEMIQFLDGVDHASQ